MSVSVALRKSTRVREKVGIDLNDTVYLFLYTMPRI